jgi:transcriptional regulator NrdR family protein
MAVIIKNGGHAEHYDEKKIFTTVYASAINAHLNEQRAEEIANKITMAIDEIVQKSNHMKSVDIKNEITNLLIIEDADVALLYQHHTNIC